MLPVKDNIPATGVPIATIGLVLANVVVYVVSIAHGGGFFSGPSIHEVFKYGAIPYALSHGGAHCVHVLTGWSHALGGHMDPAFHARALNVCGPAIAATGVPRMNTIASGLTVFTAMFMHASPVQLLGNMLFLWIFGNTVERSLGGVRYLLLYIVAGIAALAVQVAIAPHSTAPTLGAAGAVAGVLGAYLVLHPRGKVLTVVLIVLFFTIIELPLWIMIGAWIAEQAAFGATDLITPAGGRDAIAYFAYIGGFAFGLLAVKPLAGRLRPPRSQAQATA